MMTLGAIVAGFILDLIFGDPHWLPHPICLIGNLIGFLDKKLRRMLAPGETALLLGGALMVIIVLVLCRAVCCADVVGTGEPLAAFCSGNRYVLPDLCYKMSA